MSLPAPTLLTLRVVCLNLLCLLKTIDIPVVIIRTNVYGIKNICVLSPHCLSVYQTILTINNQLFPIQNSQTFSFNGSIYCSRRGTR